MGISLNPRQLTTELVDSGLYRRVETVASTGSTNADLMEAAGRSDFPQQWPHLSVLVAQEQTAGRGRLGRSWDSPGSASLAVSVVLRPALLLAEQRPWLPMFAGAVMVETLNDLGLNAGLKWPNDVHVDGRKIAGILAQVPPGDSSAVIVGVGINLLQQPAELPVATATSLRIALQDMSSTPEHSSAATPHSDEEISAVSAAMLTTWLRSMAKELIPLEQDPEQEGPQTVGKDAATRFHGRVKRVLTTLGQPVRLELPDGSAVRGPAVDLDTHGGLRVEVTSQREARLDPEAGGGSEDLWKNVPAHRRTFTVGDVVHLRPLTPSFGGAL